VRRYPGALPDPVVPTGKPLAGRWVRLDLLTEADLDEMYPLLADPAVYAHGYVMHHRPASLDDARGLARSVFLARQGQADGGRMAQRQGTPAQPPRLTANRIGVQAERRKAA
jgi:hypothetical protein